MKMNASYTFQVLGNSLAELEARATKEAIGFFDSTNVEVHLRMQTVDGLHPAARYVGHVVALRAAKHDLHPSSTANYTDLLQGTLRSILVASGYEDPAPGPAGRQTAAQGTV